MDAADEAVLFHELLVGFRAVSGVGPDGARRVGLVEQVFAQARTFLGSGVRRHPFADDPEAAIDRDVVLIAEGRDGDVDRR